MNRDANRHRSAVIVALLAAATSGACATSSPPATGRGGFRDLEVPSRWGDYPLAGALARIGGARGLDWEDHLTNCGLSDDWIEEMKAAWWSEREYDIRTLLGANLDTPFAGLGGIEERVESIRIRYGAIGGETTVENGLLREARAKRSEMIAACPLLSDPEIYWIEEAIFADEVTIVLETTAGDTLDAAAIRGLVGTTARWSISEDGIMRADGRVYVAFRDASPAAALLDAQALEHAPAATTFASAENGFRPIALDLGGLGRILPPSGFADGLSRAWRSTAAHEPGRSRAGGRTSPELRPSPGPQP